MDYPRPLVLGHFSVCVDDAASSQVQNLVLSMMALSLSQFVLSPTHLAGNILDLIFQAGITAEIDGLAWDS